MLQNLIVVAKRSFPSCIDNEVNESISHLLYYNYSFSSPESTIVTLLDGFPDDEPTDSMFLTISSPSRTFPKTTCRPSNHSVLVVVIKNWLPFVDGPAIG